MVKFLSNMNSRELVNLAQGLWIKELDFITHISGPSNIPRATQALHTQIVQCGVCVCSSRHGEAVHNCYKRWQSVMGEPLGPKGVLRPLYDQSLLILHYVGSLGGSILVGAAWLHLSTKLGS